jgi:hypothetical protein
MLFVSSVQLALPFWHTVISSEIWGSDSSVHKESSLLGNNFVSNGKVTYVSEDPASSGSTQSTCGLLRPLPQAAGSSETSATIYKCAWRHVPEDFNAYFCCFTSAIICKYFDRQQHRKVIKFWTFYQKKKRLKTSASPCLAVCLLSQISDWMSDIRPQHMTSVTMANSNGHFTSTRGQHETDFYVSTSRTVKHTTEIASAVKQTSNLSRQLLLETCLAEIYTQPVTHMRVETHASRQCEGLVTVVELKWNWSISTDVQYSPVPNFTENPFGDSCV